MVAEVEQKHQEVVVIDQVILEDLVVEDQDKVIQELEELVIHLLLVPHKEILVVFTIFLVILVKVLQEGVVQPQQEVKKIIVTDDLGQLVVLEKM